MGKKAHRFGIGYVLCGYKIYNNTQKHASYTSIRLLHLAFISSVFRTRLFFFMPRLFLSFSSQVFMPTPPGWTQFPFDMVSAKSASRHIVSTNKHRTDFYAHSRIKFAHPLMRWTWLFDDKISTQTTVWRSFTANLATDVLLGFDIFRYCIRPPTVLLL